MTAAVSSLLLFGATGDLSQRMLLPSLYGLHADGLLPGDMTIIGTAKSEYDDGGFRALAKAALGRFIEAERLPASTVDSFLGRLRYVSVDATKTENFAALANSGRADRSLVLQSSCRRRPVCSASPSMV